MLLSPFYPQNQLTMPAFFICSGVHDELLRFATHAVTVDGEWVTPESVQQVDFDLLHLLQTADRCSV
ncbi:hypothetical protein DA391_00350 [Yersinia massiliensis]|uniref:Uncharacterized protein n=1 Tax=Yersinia massiliensis TaxID=419257 RepID=A0ABM6UMT6_9GAMM|nr:hypothetical protein DA391_00350 [Yersinia massiliensis]